MGSWFRLVMTGQVNVKVRHVLFAIRISSPEPQQSQANVFGIISRIYFAFSLRGSRNSFIIPSEFDV